jgi:hypothetical protein
MLTWQNLAPTFANMANLEPKYDRTRGRSGWTDRDRWQKSDELEYKGGSIERALYLI